MTMKSTLDGYSTIVGDEPENSDLVYIRVNDGGMTTQGKPIPVHVVPPGQFGKNDRVCEVRMKNGAVHTFGGELLAQALANGAQILRTLQKGK